MISRRKFIAQAASSAAGLAIAASAKGYSQILGSNDRVNFAIIGLHGRAYAHLSSLKANQKSSRVSYVCDVESNILSKFASSVNEELGYAPATEKDFRNVLASKDVDAVAIATPDHWHAPMAIQGLQAGKHIYVEKPCSYNPAEGQMLVRAQNKSGKLVQMGTQQRSSPHTIQIVQEIRDGRIGDAYMAEAWYVNKRGSIGVGKEVGVPDSLDWDLWQGPAPRRPYHDNYQPYNWHWFKHWGTGETLNNGTHEVDVCRWALDVEYPDRVQAQGGRYAFNDDWQFYDTLTASWRYGGKLISWEGRSCNPVKRYDRDRGSLILGTKGSVLVDRDGYEVYDLEGKKTDEFKLNAPKTSSADTTGKDSMTDAHFANLIAGIQGGQKLHAPIQVGVVAVTMLQLANYAWETQRVLKLDPANNGRITDDREALALTSREYQKGWEPHV